MTRPRTGWLFIAPAFIHLLVFALIPVGYALWLSVHDWDILAGTIRFVGADQYAALMRDGEFWASLRQTGLYALYSVIPGMALALGVAWLVTRPLRGMGVFRTLFYIPAVSSGVAVAMLWVYVYLPESGMINTLLGLMGISGPDFLNDADWALPALAFMAMWVGLGPRMIIYAAGILGLPESVYEAARLDGANGMAQFWRITMPLLAPTHLFVLVTSSIAAFQTFTSVYMMTQGRPLGTTDLVGFHIYETAWRQFDVSGASAQSFVLLLVLGLLSIGQFRVMRRSLEGYDAG